MKSKILIFIDWYKPGFKAGGPNYLLQFVNEKATSINTVAIGGNPDLLNKKSVT